MSFANITSSSLGNALQTLLVCDEIVPGEEPSYNLCKAIYSFHPLGAKMASKPISIAQSQKREITIPAGPEEVLREAFEKEWGAVLADECIFQLATLARVYGISTLASVAQGVPSDRPIDPNALASVDMAFSIFDPLNTAGSLVLNQQPNAVDFLKVKQISVQGSSYHRSRTVTLMNERPIYLAYTNSAFGYVGRSVYQRALFPLKSYIQTMVTNDMVSRKAGLLVAKMKPAGSIVDNIMATMAGVKRQLLKEARTDSVISISVEEAIETLNLQNLDGAFGMARKNILEDIAAADDMPAKMLTEESMSSSFNEGTEESKRVIQYVDNKRAWMQPAYSFMDEIVMRRAWNADFYETMKSRYPESYGNKTHKQAFYEWSNSFKAEWPSLIREPESEKVKVDETKLNAINNVVIAFQEHCDPANKARLLQWAADNINENKTMFTTSLELDWEALADHVETQSEQEQDMDEDQFEPKPKMVRKDAQPLRLQVKR
ncbi:MAG: DUF1073 domain-containing protein [Patescibacteria group bacterium]|nr:DUF1073 domain-containing protein [Patescibacteria group bacterium]